MHAWSTMLSQELKQKPISKRKRVRLGVLEISPVSIYGEVYGGKDLKKRRVFLSLECHSLVVRWKDKMWMRLKERKRKFIPKVGATCLKERFVILTDDEVVVWRWWQQTRIEYQFKKIHRLRGSTNLVREREACIQYVPWSLASAETWEQWVMWEPGGFDNSVGRSFRFVEV